MTSFTLYRIIQHLCCHLTYSISSLNTYVSENLRMLLVSGIDQIASCSCSPIGAWFVAPSLVSACVSVQPRNSDSCYVVVGQSLASSRAERVYFYFDLVTISLHIPWKEVWLMKKHYIGYIICNVVTSRVSHFRSAVGSSKGDVRASMTAKISGDTPRLLPSCYLGSILETILELFKT